MCASVFPSFRHPREPPDEASNPVRLLKLEQFKGFKLQSCKGVTDEHDAHDYLITSLLGKGHPRETVQVQKQ